jgi:hypothetical protein
VRYIAPIVEGHGEVEAVPALLHRLANTFNCPDQLVVNYPIRVKSGSFFNDTSYFNKLTTLALEKAASKNGSVLIIMDCEDDCPATIGPKFLNAAKAIRDDIPIVVGLAYREFETWFIAAAESLRGVYGLPNDLVTPATLDDIRGAKEWIGRRMPGGYDPMLHQRIFVSKFDFTQARTCHSFDRLYEKLRPLLGPQMHSPS